ncbi:MAG: hypothetical protein AAF346_12485 [Pseudomonadota bacterium]
MIKQSYDLIMDPESNPLRALPIIVRFRLMAILALMWCSVFTIWTGWIALYGPSVAAHLVLLVGVFFTADVFRQAGTRAANHRDAMRNPRDGTVLHDDIWGG